MPRIDVTSCLHADGSGARFLASLAQLAHMAGVSPEATALYLHAGRSAELAARICTSIAPALQGQHDAALAAFLRKATLFRPAGTLEEIRSAVYHALATPDDMWTDAGDPSPVFVPGEAAAMEALTRLIRLTTALGYPPRTIARIIHAGRFRELVQALCMDNRLRTSMAYVHELNALNAVAATFMLPERFARCPEALMRRVECIAGR